MAPQPEETDIEMQALPHRTSPLRSQEADAAEAQATVIQPSPDSTPPCVYEHAQLGDSPTAIRVLEVAEQHDGGAAIISCKLHTIDLAASPRFTALSYVWGDPTLCEVIWIGERPLRVTRSAWQALRGLRQQFAPLMIWIDAICIDQKNAGEKARQIPLMGQIYSYATRVYIWLGPGSEKTDRALHHLQRGALPLSFWKGQTLSDFFPSLEGADKIPTGPHLKYRMAIFSAATVVGVKKKAPLFSELQELFSNLWITRIWTLQEVLLAHSPVLVKGEVSVTWQAFLCACEVFELFSNRTPNRPIARRFLRLPREIEPWLELVTLWKAERPVVGSAGPAHRLVSRSTGVGQVAPPSQPTDQDLEGLTALKRHAFYMHHTESTSSQLLLATLTMAPFLLTSGVALVILGLGISRSSPALILPGSVIIVSTMLAIGFQEMLSFRNLVHMVPMQRTLALMSQVAVRQCTNRSDTYYGVLGLISGKRPATSPLPEGTNAYRALCLDLIPWSDSLDFLLFRSPTNKHGASSWVVQWHEADVRWTFYLHDKAMGTLGRREIPEVVQCATHGSKAWYSWSESFPHQLKVHGFSVGTVQWTACADPQATPETRKRAIQRQLQNSDPHISEWAERLPRAYERWKRSDLEKLSDLAATDARAIVLLDTPADTSASRPPGLAPRDVAIGDRLFLVAGLSMPLLLRPATAGQHHVVGPAWVIWMMHGEAWTAGAEQGLEEIILV